MLADLAGAPVSVDTSKAAVARRALELGVELVNDVTALRGDPELAGVVADAGCYLCLMHMRGEPRTMQDDPVYEDVVSDVKRFLAERLAVAVDAGVREDLICLDPGIGFGKTVGAQLRAAAPARRARRARPADPGRGVAEELARADHGRPGGADRLDRRVGRRRGRGLRARRDDPPRPRRAAHVEALAAAHAVAAVRVELAGLELRGFHGVEEDERRHGQRFLFDVVLEVGERGVSDRIEDAVDYREVARTVARRSTSASFSCSRRSRPRSRTRWRSGSGRSRCRSRPQAAGAAGGILPSTGARSPSCGRDDRLRRARCEPRRP